MLTEIADRIAYVFLGLEPGVRLAEAVHFFIYDTLKIFMLLSAIIFAVSVVRSYFPLERTWRLYSNKKLFIGNGLAAGLGVVTPFCSCLAVPVKKLIREEIR